MACQSVLIRAPGQSDMRLIVPAKETDGDPIAEAVAMTQSLMKVSPTQWIVEIYETHNVTDMEIKQ